MKSAVKPKKKKAAAGRAPLTVRNLDERLRLLVKNTEAAARESEADRDRLARLEESLAKDRVNNENHRDNAARALEQEFAASLPRVMREHNIRIRPRDVKMRVRKGRKRLEYDIVAPNGEIVLVGEVKTRLTRDDVLKMVGALRAFRRDYPEYAGLKLHGVVAGNIVEDDALTQALEEGFFVLRMDGAEVHPATKKGYKPAEY